MEKEYDAAAIDLLQIDGDGMFKISVKSTESSSIKIVAAIEGETFENVLLQIQQDGSNMLLSQGFSPFFTPENDKLAAHKVIAVELLIFVPDTIVVQCKANDAFFYGEGYFKELVVETKSGDCNLNNFDGKATIITNSGNITARVASTIVAQAFSKKGTVVQRANKGENPSLIIESVTGDIQILETE